MGLRLQKKSVEANKELDLPPKNLHQEKHDREMEKLSKKQTEGDKKRTARLTADYDKQVKEVMEGLGVPRPVAENIVMNTLILGKKKKSPPSYKHGGKVKKPKAKKMMGGGKVYSRGSRKAKYNG